MADLSYDDVRRASQEAVRDLSNVLNELRASHDDIRRNIQQLDNVTFRLNSMQSQLNVIQQQLENHMTAMRPITANAQGTQQNVHNSLADMSRRVNAIEQMMRACYQYLASQEQRYQQYHHR